MPQPGQVKVADFGNRINNVSITGSLLGAALPRIGEAISDSLFGMSPQAELQHQYAENAKYDLEEKQLGNAMNDMLLNKTTPQAALEAQGLDPEMTARLQSRVTPAAQMGAELQVARAVAAGAHTTAGQQQVWNDLNARDGQDMQGQYSVHPASSQAMQDLLSMVNPSTPQPQLSEGTRARAEVLSSRLSGSLQALSDIQNGKFGPASIAHAAFAYRQTAKTAEDLNKEVQSELGLSGRITDPIQSSNDLMTIMLSKRNQDPVIRQDLIARGKSPAALAKLDQEALEATARLHHQGLTQNDLTALIQSPYTQTLMKAGDPYTNLATVMGAKHAEEQLQGLIAGRNFTTTQTTALEQKTKEEKGMAPIREGLASAELSYAQQSLPYRLQQLDTLAKMQGINTASARWELLHKGAQAQFDQVYKVAGLRLQEMQVDKQALALQAQILSGSVMSQRNEAIKLQDQATKMEAINSDEAARLRVQAKLYIDGSNEAESALRALVTSSKPKPSSPDAPTPQTPFGSTMTTLEDLNKQLFQGVDPVAQPDATTMPGWWQAQGIGVVNDKYGLPTLSAFPKDTSLLRYSAWYGGQVMANNKAPFPDYNHWMKLKTIPVAKGLYKSPEEYSKDSSDLQKAYTLAKQYYNKKMAGG